MRLFYKLEVRRSVMGQKAWLTYHNGQRVTCWSEENAQVFNNYKLVEEVINQLKREGYSSVWISTYFVDINEITL